MTSSTPPRDADAAPCAACGVPFPPTLLACPSCGALVHAAELTRLAGLAEEAERQGELASALTTWKDALALLPPGAAQRAVIEERVAALNERVLAGEATAGESKSPGVSDAWRSGGVLAAAGALALKFKGLIFILLTKAKLVILGLTKLKTLLSMLAFFGVYWARWGWKFALGFVLSIYVHEMGHVVAARRFGIKATAPVFIPFVGAFILLKEAVTDVRINARIGLAGPVWGLGAALAAYGGYLATGEPLLAAIAGFGAWINMFNLIPVWTLDGARGFSALTRTDRLCVAGALGAMAFVVPSQPLLILLAVIAAGVALFTEPAPKSDRPMLVLYLFLAVSLAAIGTTSIAAVRASTGARF